MPVVRTLLEEWLDRVDHRVLAAWYRATSVRPDRLRAALRRDRAAFLDPARSKAAPAPTLLELDRTARRVVEVAANAASRRSGFAGLVGAMSLPPEVVMATIAALRLAQRLCVVYGFDPHTDRGRMALCQALATAYDVELPASGPEGLRVTELAALVAPHALPPSSSARLTRAMASSTARRAVATRRRWLPLIGARRQAEVSRDGTIATGERMIGVLRRLSGVPGPTRARLVDAEEVPSP